MTIIARGDEGVADGAAQLHRAILRSTGIIGGASALNVVSTLIRTKIAALILGPAGLGLIGLLISFMTTAGSLASWGIGNVATRQMAEAGPDRARAAAALRAMLFAAAGMAALGVAVVVLLRRPIAEALLGDAGLADAVGWLAAGVGLLVLFNAAVGLLTGLRRVGDVARVSVVSALLASAVAIAGLLILGQRAILLFVLAGPAASALVALFYLRRASGAASPLAADARISQMAPHWRALAGLGLAFTVAAVVATASQFALRTLVQNQLGAVAVGYFHASWQISTNYIGFILTAMAVDYYPRLTRVIGDRAQAVRSINHQGEVALLLAGPILVGTAGFAHWLIPLLYSGEFLPLIEILRWQIMGDLLKIAAWALGIVMIAAGRGRLFVMTECLAAVVLVGLTAVLLPLLGLKAPGVAYFAMCLLYLPLIYAIARHVVGFAASRPLVEAFAAVGFALLVTLAASARSTVLGAAAGAVLAVLLGVFAVYRLRRALPSFVRKLKRRL